jgi:NTE family protein
MEEQRTAALVLSGGGALGAAHIGVLRALEARQLRFDFLAGVSAGAIICALIACGMRSVEKAKRGEFFLPGL